MVNNSAEKRGMQEMYERIDNMTDAEKDEFFAQVQKLSQDKNNRAYLKYVKPVLDQEKRENRNRFTRWLRENWVGLITLMVAALTLIVTLISE